MNNKVKYFLKSFSFELRGWDIKSQENIYKLDLLVLTLGGIYYFFGYYFLAVLALIYLIMRVFPNFKQTFVNKLALFNKDQETIKNHYTEDFSFFYYFAMAVRFVTVCFYIYFFYFLAPENIEKYSFILFSVTYIFLVTNLIDLGIITFIILYKNEPVGQKVMMFCYNCVIKGVPALGALHMSSNVPMISPNPVSNFYHLYSPAGRGYGAYSSVQLLQVDLMKTELCGEFDYTKCVDSNNFLDSKKMSAYAKEEGIDLKTLAVNHNVYWWSQPKK